MRVRHPVPSSADVLVAVGSADVLVAVGGGCTGCGLCIPTCPEQALRRARGAPELDAGRCSGCLECVEVCPTGTLAPAGHAGGASGATERREGAALRVATGVVR
ncbi:MAG: 4Fe-4S binding protein [Actinomycetota bacterium]|nr:4Fe-4S binding protein [Actinomycetota bacterium]